MNNSELLIITPHHTGIIVADLETAMDAYIENFGYGFFLFEVNERNATLSESSASFSVRIGMGQLGLNLIELIQPVTGTTLYSQHLAQEGPGLHHLGFSASDVGVARQQLEARGYSCLQNGKINGLVDFSYYQSAELACIVEPLHLSCDLAGFLLKNAQLYTRKSATA